MTEEDLQKAFYCGHKLDNILRTIEIKTDYLTMLSTTQSNDLNELLILAKDASYHIKWMHKKLSDLAIKYTGVPENRSDFI